MKVIDGKKVAEKMKDKLKECIKSLDITPRLAIISIGDNEANAIYIKNKINTCTEIGIKAYEYKFNQDSTEEEIISCIKELNDDTSIHGIIIQSPILPKFDENYLNSFISPNKDVDGFGIANMGALATNQTKTIAATPKGIIELLKSENIPIKSQNVVIIGRSNIVGRPLALALLNLDATVTITHSKTKNLKEITKNADILIVAIGKPNFITNEYIKENAIIIDVGINRNAGKLCGDVDFESVKDKVSYITPVPGGDRKSVV